MDEKEKSEWKRKIIDDHLRHAGVLEIENEPSKLQKLEKIMRENKDCCKLLNAEEIAKKLHAFDNFLEAVNVDIEGNDNLALTAVIHAFRMQFLDYYYQDKDYHNWESNSQ